MLKYFILFASVGVSLSVTSLSDTYDEKNLTDKVAVVTGAAVGIGKAITENLLMAGVKVVIMVDMKEKEGIEASEEFNAKYGENKTYFITCDIREGLEEVTETITKLFGYVDLLVNNAGVMDEYDLETVVNTNVLATLKWAEKYHSIMRQDNGGHCGTIINIASIAATLGIPFIPQYKATKCAVLGYSQGLGHEYTYNQTCVRVMSLSPGLTYTSMTEQQMVTDDQVTIFNKFRAVSAWQEPDYVGKAVVKIFQNATSGTSWDVTGREDPVQSPLFEPVTAEYLYSL